MKHALLIKNIKYIQSSFIFYIWSLLYRFKLMEQFNLIYIVSL